MAIADLRRRSFTAIFIGAAVIGLCLSGNIASSLLLILIGFLAAMEYWTMALNISNKTTKTLFGLVLMLPAAIYLCSAQLQIAVLDPYIDFLLLPVCLGLVTVVSIIADPSDTARYISVTATGLLLFTIPVAFGLRITGISHYWLLGIFGLLWASDIFAYITGSLIGRTKLTPAISPGKTWEGVIGGTLVAAGLAAAVPGVLAVAALVVVFGTIGDLTQSAVKRLYGVKDSGSSLPGHGGFWDRFDSLLGCLPWVGLYFLLFHHF